MPANFDLEITDWYIEKKYAKDLLRALEELIANSLDADATKIEVSFSKNALGWIEWLTVVDNGEGLDYIQAEWCFKSLWSSWKKRSEKTKSGRYLIWKNGEWRLFAVSAASRVEWHSYYNDPTWKIRHFTISNQNSDKRFSISLDSEADVGHGTGMSITIENLAPRLTKKISTKKIKQELTLNFAHYLKTYDGQSIQILIDWELLDIREALESDPYEEYVSVKNDIDGNSHTFHVSIFHWKDKGVHERFFCLKDFSLVHRDSETGVLKSNFGHSVYITGDYINENANSFVLIVGQSFFIDLSKAIKESIEKMYLSILKWKSAQTVKKLVEDGIYPYKELPKNDIEEEERQIFDVCLHQIAARSEKFNTDSIDSKRIIVGLLRSAVEKDVKSVIPIFQSVLNLTEPEMKEFATLIEQYTLPHLIRLSKIVSDKLSFIHEIGLIIQDPEYKKNTLERKHLHTILERELWVFGDGYAEGTSDQTLKDVLVAHIGALWRTELIDESAMQDLSDDRPDLFIHKQYPQSTTNQFEHLVVELKRPSKTLGMTEINQIESYAGQVSSDYRFDKDNTRWTFYLIGDQCDSYAQDRKNQTHLPKGCISSTKSYTIWVFSWSEILQGLRWKYQHLRDKIELTTPDPRKFTYLSQHYPEIVTDMQNRMDKKLLQISA